MQRKLSAARKGKIQGDAVIATENLQIVGWALLWCDKRGPFAYFYIRKSARRRGIGSKIMRAVLTHAQVTYDTPVGVWAHDDAACAFFDNFKDEVVLWW